MTMCSEAESVCVPNPQEVQNTQRLRNVMATGSTSAIIKLIMTTASTLMILSSQAGWKSPAPSIINASQ